MAIQEISLKEFRKKITDTFFNESYKKLQLNLDLNDSEKINLLRNAVIFSNFGDINLQKLGYKILVSYSNKYLDYKPLYDFSINKGYIPISKFIEQKHLGEYNYDDHFFGLFFSSFKDNFKEKNYYISNGQKKLVEFSNRTQDNFVLVAPTSYGKSEIIVNKVFYHLDKKVCVIVPSKALLAQTKKRLLNNTNNNNLQRIITHPEMYKGTENNFVAVLTQERLLRMLQKNPELKLDLVLVDEAHNLLGEKKNNQRSTLLAQTIIILKRRNEQVIFNFFSPFISNSENLRVKQSNYTISSQKTDEFIKSEKYFICDVCNSSGELKLYDQFSNSFFHTSINYNSHIDLLNAEKADKNVIYLNKPKHIEEFSVEYANSLNGIELNLSEITTTISDFLHPDYNLIKCIQKGLVYHHGGMPEIVRLYVENIFSKYNELKFIVTSSTLLEGVNIPAEKLFLLSNRKGKSNLTVSQFKNLIGRVNRFSEIFNPENGNLKLLEPHIYLIKSKYLDQRSNIENFIKINARTEIDYSDSINNVLLKDESDLTTAERVELKSTLEFLENIEPNSTDLSNVEYVKSEIAKLCYKNNIQDFDIKLSESQLEANLSNYKRNSFFTVITNSNQLMNCINAIFFNEIVIKEDSIKRLQNQSARNFYSMILNWRSSSASYREMIVSFMAYWSSLHSDELLIYIGDRWGEVKRNNRDIKPLYINLSEKNNAQRINLAILKIKEEQDFLDNKLLKYIDIISELSLLDPDFYDRIKYGSSNKFVITLLKNGFSIELAKCVTKQEYSKFISIKTDTDDIVINSQLIDEMTMNSENKILIFEIKFHINEHFK